MLIPKRGFSLTEYENRLRRAHSLMGEQKIDALFLCTEPEIRYFSGFMTQFWESPTRPWFLIIPLENMPIAVIPEIGMEGMKNTWIKDIRTWPAPQPENDGITLLSQALSEIPKPHGQLGALMGHETQLRMPLIDFQKLQKKFNFIDASKLMRKLRNIKSQEEIKKIRFICQQTSESFEALPQTLKVGKTEYENCQQLKIDLLERGADSVPYLVASSGKHGYKGIIMGPTERVIEKDDILIIDTGAKFDGYFCDFDRNFAFSPPGTEVQQAYNLVYKATDAGFFAAHPGATTSDLWHAMSSILENGASQLNQIGRMGHGIGMQLTEGPSVAPNDETILEVGMVLTLEPSMTMVTGKQMVHEENIVITEDGAEYLSKRAPREIPVII